MAKIVATIPQETKVNDCSKFRSWLLTNFYDQMCAYCLINHKAVEIDHYKPVSGFANLEKIHTNLLLSCSSCNKNKSDYHPKFKERRRAPNNKSGFEVIHLLRQDLAEVFAINQEGSFHAKRGPFESMGKENIELLGLNIEFLKNTRKYFLESIGMAMYLLELSKSDPIAKSNLQQHISYMSKHELFYLVMDIEIDPVLWSYLNPGTYRCVMTKAPKVVKKKVLKKVRVSTRTSVKKKNKKRLRKNNK